MNSLCGLDRGEMGALLDQHGFAPGLVDELWGPIYARGATHFTQLDFLSMSTREKLARTFTVARPEITREQTSADGTRKWLVRLADGHEVETVYIPDGDRGAVCVSSQVGCTLSCDFCHTGTQPVVRNLTSAEIVAQVVLARDAYGDFAPGRRGRNISSVVLMGMGEPLLNYDNVTRAVRVMMDEKGLAISRRRITLSTSGVVPKIDQLGRELGVMLAISLHATNDPLRDVLVPINKKWPLAELLRACRDYPANNARRILFEYVMLRDVNDSLTDARALVKLLEGLPAKVNLIPFNPWPGTTYECSTPAQVEAFAAELRKAGYPSPVRQPRGRDISAACGQLKSASARHLRVVHS